jgi:hypothetical protein
MLECYWNADDNMQAGSRRVVIVLSVVWSSCGFQLRPGRTGSCHYCGGDENCRNEFDKTSALY